MDAAIYERARAAGLRAATALALARQGRPEVPEYGAPLDIGEREGFTIRASVDYDEGLSLEDLGYGRFVDGVRDWRTDYLTRPDPDAVRNPDRDSRNVSGGAAWYVPGAMGSMRERAQEYRRTGAARGVAWDLARESIEDELRTVTRDYGPSVYIVTVTASRAGVVLGTASLGGVETAYDPITRSFGEAWIAECIEELIPEAIDDARETLDRLARVPDAADD